MHSFDMLEKDQVPSINHWYQENTTLKLTEVDPDDDAMYTLITIVLEIPRDVEKQRQLWRLIKCGGLSFLPENCRVGKKMQVSLSFR